MNVRLGKPILAVISVVIATAILAVGCVADEQTDVAGVELVDGFSSTLVLDGLRSPTQVAVGEDGDVFVAQLNGEEGDVTGQILKVDLNTSSRVVLYDGLDKPTGVAVIGESLYIMERNRLTVGDIEGNRARNVIADDLPSNGRSEGSLNLSPDLSLLYNTSGSISGGEVVDDSGVVWEIPGIGQKPRKYATGFKNAYSQTFADDVVYVTEVSDGTFDGTAAADEVVEIGRGGDGGWPVCVGDQRPVKEYGGDQAACQNTSETVALFKPGATPTSVIVAPWAEEQLLVALWNEGRVVQVSRTEERPADVQTFIEGVEHPQSLLVVEGSVWLTDFEKGRIVAVSLT